MILYLYSPYLVLMTTQSSSQYSFTFTHSHTHSYSASMSSTCLFYEGQFGTLQHADGEDWGSNCRPSGWRTTTLPLSHSRPFIKMFPPFNLVHYIRVIPYFSLDLHLPSKSYFHTLNIWSQKKKVTWVKTFIWALLHLNSAWKFCCCYFRLRD